MTAVGPIGRMGRWTATHVRTVVIAWAVIAVGLGAFAPKAEHALSGAGWEAADSESVAARKLLDEEFGGISSYALTAIVHSESARADDPAFVAAVARARRILAASPAVGHHRPRRRPVTGARFSSPRAAPAAHRAWSPPPTTSRAR